MASLRGLVAGSEEGAGRPGSVGLLTGVRTESLSDTTFQGSQPSYAVAGLPQRALPGMGVTGRFLMD